MEPDPKVLELDRPVFGRSNGTGQVEGPAEEEVGEDGHGRVGVGGEPPGKGEAEIGEGGDDGDVAEVTDGFSMPDGGVSGSITDIKSRTWPRKPTDMDGRRRRIPRIICPLFFFFFFFFPLLAVAVWLRASSAWPLAFLACGQGGGEVVGTVRVDSDSHRQLDCTRQRRASTSS
ncbi:hypothetical protein NL676_021714 [Syzygium grande]|nr:hypothetical protein NL676_021714 [Syzygium grande]